MYVLIRFGGLNDITAASPVLASARLCWEYWEEHYANSRRPIWGPGPTGLGCPAGRLISDADVPFYKVIRIGGEG